LLVQPAGVRATCVGHVRQRGAESRARSASAELGPRAVQDVRSAERHARTVQGRGVQLPELSEPEPPADESDEWIVRPRHGQDQRTEHSTESKAALLRWRQENTKIRNARKISFVNFVLSWISWRADQR